MEPNFEVVWPRFKAHYLNAESDPMTSVVSPNGEPEPAPPVRAREDVPIADGTSATWIEVGRNGAGVRSTARAARPPRRGKRRPARRAAALAPAALPARALAVEALSRGAGSSLSRLSLLFGLSRRTVSRTLSRTVADVTPVLEAARQCLLQTTDRGSTDAERAAALAWLNRAESGSDNGRRDTGRPKVGESSAPDNGVAPAPQPPTASAGATVRLKPAPPSRPTGHGARDR